MNWAFKASILLAGGWTLSGVKASSQRAWSLTLALFQQPEAADVGDLLVSFFDS